MGDLPCAGTLVSPTGEELHSGLDDTHFRDTSSRCFFHDLQSLSCVSKSTMGGHRFDGFDLADANFGSDAAHDHVQGEHKLGSYSSCGPAHRPCLLASQN